MFRATMCPSWGEITVSMRHLVFVTLFRWLSGMQAAPCIPNSHLQSDNYQVSHRYSYFSWWWAHSRPKHVEKRNKHNKKICAPIWFFLQDFFLFKSVKIGCSIRPAVDSLPGYKVEGAWTWPLNSSRIGMQNEWRYNCSPIVHLHGVHKDNSLYFFCFISCLSRVNNLTFWHRSYTFKF